MDVRPLSSAESSRAPVAEVAQSGAPPPAAARVLSAAAALPAALGRHADPFKPPEESDSTESASVHPELALLPESAPGVAPAPAVNCPVPRGSRAGEVERLTAAVVPPHTPVSQILHTTAFATPLTLNTFASPSALAGTATARSKGARAQGPLLRGRVGGESPLMAAPTPATPVKQRRTIHCSAPPGGSGDGGSAAMLGFGAQLRALGAGPVTSPASPVVISSPALRSGGAGRLVELPGPRMPQQKASKYARAEGSRKRSADGLSQFSAMDIDESVGSPSQRSCTSAQAPSYRRFPSQPPTPSLPMGASRTFMPVGASAGDGSGAVLMGSPLLASCGFATPTALSQQLDLARVGGSLSQMLAPSQEFVYGGGGTSGAEGYSQAETESSNIFTKRILTEFTEVRELGHGAFGRVALYEEALTGQQVAIKVSGPLHTGTDAERIYRRERAIMTALHGSTSHVTQLLGSWEEGRVPRMYLQLEYCPGGSLAAAAERKRAAGETWEEDELTVLLLHMTIALDAMHSRRIAHVDFKPDNVLIDAFGNYKLSDFGCSAMLDAAGRPLSDRRLTEAGGGRADAGGSPRVQRQSSSLAATDFSQPPSAPLMESTQLSTMSIDEGDCRYLCSDMLNGKQHLLAGDMFSLGMSLYELMSGAPLPRGGDAFLMLRRRIPEEALRRRGYSERLIGLVAALLREEPTTRPTARQILQSVRPSIEDLSALGDEMVMREWTSLHQTPARGEAANEESDPNPLSPASTTDPSSGALQPALLRRLRLCTATVEASAWLLETARCDYMLAHHLTHHTAADGGRNTTRAPGRGSTSAFSPSSCVTPLTAGLPPMLPGGAPALHARTAAVAAAAAAASPAGPMRSSRVAPRGQSGIDGESVPSALVYATSALFTDSDTRAERRLDEESGADTAAAWQRRQDACTPTSVTGPFGW